MRGGKFQEDERGWKFGRRGEMRNAKCVHLIRKMLREEITWKAFVGGKASFY
jgi:hypothetical protein